MKWKVIPESFIDWTFFAYTTQNCLCLLDYLVPINQKMLLELILEKYRLKENRVRPAVTPVLDAATKGNHSAFGYCVNTQALVRLSIYTK